MSELMSSFQPNVEAVAGWDRYSGYGMIDIDAAVGCNATPVIAGNAGFGHFRRRRPAKVVRTEFERKAATEN